MDQLSREVMFQTAPERLYLTEDFHEAAQRLHREAQARQVQGALTMQTEQRSHPDQPRRQPAATRRSHRGQPSARGRQGRRGGVPEIAHRVGERRRAPPGRRRHRRAGRRRVRQVDGLQGQLPRLVELFLHAAGRLEDRGHRSRQPCRSTVPAPDNTVLSTFADRRDRARFAAAYADPDRGSRPARAR